MKQSLLGFLILLSFVNGCASMLKSRASEPAPIAATIGGLKTHEVTPVIRSHMDEVRSCYETTAMKENRIGRVVMRFTIDKDGVLNQPQPNLDEVRSPALISCMSTKMVAWRFPKPRAGVPVNVNYPFSFTITKSAVANSAPPQSRPATASSPGSKGKS